MIGEHTIHVGDRVVSVGFYAGRYRGIVTSITEGFSQEDHGCIEVRLDSGELEHFVYFGWGAHLKITEHASPPPGDG